MRDGKVFALLLALILAFSLVPAGAAETQGTTVEVNEGKTITIAPGGTVSTIPLNIKGIPDLGPDNGVGAFTFELSWGATIIHVDNVTAETIAGFPITVGPVDNDAGTVRIAGFAFPTLLTGDVTVATLNISAQGAAGTSTSINVTIIDLGDKDGITIAASPVNAPVEIVGVVPPPPTVTAVNPNSGNQGAILDVTITGTNFTGATAVGFGAGITVNNFTVDSATQITASITIAPDAAPGTRDVSVTTPGGTDTLTDGFRVTAPPIPEYTLTMAVIGSGTTTPAVGVHTYAANTVVDITATPDAGWQFVNWTGDVADPDSVTTTVTMDADKTVTAKFTELQLPTVITLEATEITHNSATLNGNLTDLGTATTVQVSFQWGTTSGALDRVTDPQAMTAPGVFYATITGLTPATTYYFRAEAVGDLTAYGAELSFTTAEMPQVMFESPTFTVAEDGVNATITVVLSQVTLNTVTVNYATVADGTATAEQDYTAVSGTLTFNSNETSKTFTIPILDDDLVEGDETVNLTLSDPTNAVLGMPHQAVLTITDDEMPEVMFESPTYTVAEDGVEATITVVLSEGTLNTVTVEYATITDGTATAGADYTAVTGTLTFNPNETSKTFTVPIIDDTDVEGDETVNLALSEPDKAALGTPHQAVLTITDDEMPEVMFDSTTYMVAEDVLNATITVVLSQATLNTVTVHYATITDGTATTGADYTAVTGTLTFNPGEPLTQTFTVPITNDDIAEGNETINLELSKATNAGLGTPRQAVLTIRDDESWLFGWSHVALIAPYPIRGRDFLTVTEPVALAHVQYDGPADGWFQVLWFNENDGTWLAYYSGFTEGNTLTHLHQHEFYYVVVSHPDTSLWTEGGW